MLLAKYYILTTDYEGAEKELLHAKSVFEDLKDEICVARVYGLKSILTERLGESAKSMSLVSESH